MPLIIPSNSISAGGYEVDNSLRFNDGSSDYLNRTQGTPTSTRKFTYSGWLKPSNVTTNKSFFSAGSGSPQYFDFRINDDGQMYSFIDNSNAYKLKTTRVFRDISAWYHVVMAIDTTQSTASNRIKIYINGVQETSFSEIGYPAQNYDIAVFGSGTVMKVGVRGDNIGYFDGYMSEVCYIDGQQLDPTSFGEFDSSSGIWKPIDVSGLTFGTNGFYLDFEDSGALGDDVSGNGNDFTVNNLTAIDQTTDTPTNNFCTLNPLNVPASNQPTFSEGNLQSISITGAGSFGGSSTFTVSSGKWYLECKALNSTSSVGISYNAGETARTNNDATDSSYEWNYKYNGTLGHGTDSSYGDSFTTNDIIGIALNLDDNELIFYKNGTAQDSGTPISITASQEYVIYHQDDTESGSNQSNFAFNFGNPPYTISSGNTDGNGYGNFEYAVPSGYLSLCTKNLSEVLG